jgi:transposase
MDICHQAVVAIADPVLDTEPEPVTVLGIDETCRGKEKYETCQKTGKRVWIDRFDTGLVDITSTGGLLVQVNGRSGETGDRLANYTILTTYDRIGRAAVER